MRGPVLVAETPNFPKDEARRGSRLQYGFLTSPNSPITDADLSFFEHCRGKDRTDGSNLPEGSRGNFLAVSEALIREDPLDRRPCAQTLVLLGVDLGLLNEAKKEALLAHLGKLLGEMNARVRACDWSQMQVRNGVCEWPLLQEWMQQPEFARLPSAEVVPTVTAKRSRWGVGGAAVAALCLVAIVTLGIYWPRVSGGAGGDNKQDDKEILQPSLPPRLTAEQWEAECKDICTTYPGAERERDAVRSQNTPDLIKAHERGKDLLGKKVDGVAQQWVNGLKQSLEAIEQVRAERQETVRRERENIEKELKIAYQSNFAGDTAQQTLMELTKSPAWKEVPYEDDFEDEKKKLTDLRKNRETHLEILEQIGKVTDFSKFKDRLEEALAKKLAPDERIQPKMLATLVVSRWATLEQKKPTNQDVNQANPWKRQDWTALKDRDRDAKEFNKLLQKVARDVTGPRADRVKAQANKLCRELLDKFKEEYSTANNTVNANNLRATWTKYTKKADAIAEMPEIAWGELSQDNKDTLEDLRAWRKLDPFKVKPASVIVSFENREEFGKLREPLFFYTTASSRQGSGAKEQPSHKVPKTLQSRKGVYKFQIDVAEHDSVTFSFSVDRKKKTTTSVTWVVRPADGLSESGPQAKQLELKWIPGKNNQPEKWELTQLAPDSNAKPSLPPWPKQMDE